MRARSIITLLFPFLLVCCSNPTVRCSFDGYEFELPNTIKEFKNKADFKYYPYMGFRAKKLSHEIIIQLKDQPLWLGDDNIGEEKYFNEKVIGIIFSRPIEEINIDEISKSLSKLYSSKFINSDEYSFIKPNKYLNIATFKKKNLYYVGFYYGLTDKELPIYVSSVR